METGTPPSLVELYPAYLSARQYKDPLVAATASVVVFLLVCTFFWRRVFGCKTDHSSFDMFAFSWVVGSGESVSSRPTFVGVLATLCVIPLGALLSYYLWLGDVESRDIKTSFESAGEFSLSGWEFNLTVFAFSNNLALSTGDCEPLVNGAWSHGFNRTDFIKGSAISGNLCVSSLYHDKVLRTDTIGVRSVSLDFPFNFQNYIVELRSWSPFPRKEYTQQILVNASSKEHFLQGRTVVTFLAQPLDITTAESVQHSGVEFSLQNLLTGNLPVADGFIIGNTSNIQLQVSAESPVSADSFSTFLTRKTRFQVDFLPQTSVMKVSVTPQLTLVKMLSNIGSGLVAFFSALRLLVCACSLTPCVYEHTWIFFPLNTCRSHYICWCFLFSSDEGRPLCAAKGNVVQVALEKGRRAWELYRLTGLKGRGNGVAV